MDIDFELKSFQNWNLNICFYLLIKWGDMELVSDKKCSCGRVWKSVPNGYAVNIEGYWWNCDCNSTLFIKSNGIAIKLAGAHVGRRTSWQGTKLIGKDGFSGKLAGGHVSTLIIDGHTMGIS